MCPTLVTLFDWFWLLVFVVIFKIFVFCILRISGKNIAMISWRQIFESKCSNSQPRSFRAPRPFFLNILSFFHGPRTPVNESCFRHFVLILIRHCIGQKIKIWLGCLKVTSYDLDLDGWRNLAKTSCKYLNDPPHDVS